MRPQLYFAFDAGRAVAAFQDAPARGVSCAPGSFVLLLPGMRARVRHDAPIEMLSLTFPRDALAGRGDPRAYIAALIGDLPRTTVDPGVRALAIEARRALVQESSLDLRYLAALGTAMLERALQVIGRGAPTHGRAAMSPFKLHRVMDHIESKLDSKITVQELAALAGLSTAHFARAFRQATGEAPHHFILTRRIARVRELLRDPTLSLATVSFRAGFSSHAHMTSAFRRLTGLAPAAYRSAVAQRLAS
ncbi:AraC family transcriptional regulator [Phenylobacterium sp.]|uniref:AraC family transcriptional regulator n=1 Tax=Phenylobacterium sp. TaxID=1871053 RepID=UPI002E3396AB|nr:AraC family transcriptional regulator [Phenylobacterium sp.]HEX3366647.1 AraC family transcriptional regulator [Phenylobacterium sp.]